jgi:hypothetical protein
MRVSVPGGGTHRLGAASRVIDAWAVRQYLWRRDGCPDAAWSIAAASGGVGVFPFNRGFDQGTTLLGRGLLHALDLSDFIRQGIVSDELPDPP